MGFVAEQRLEVLGVPVLPAGVLRLVELVGPCLPRGAVRDAALLARGVGRSRRDGMLALRAPPARADRLVGNGVGIAAAVGRPTTGLSKRTQLAVDAEVGSAKGSCAGKVGQAHGGL